MLMIPISGSHQAIDEHDPILRRLNRSKIFENASSVRQIVDGAQNMLFYLYI